MPGTQFVFEGRSNRGPGPRPHRVIFTVTGLTKKVDGVDAVVLFDRDINRGKLLEAEITFFAQDTDGNVWNFGEYPEEYAADGSFDGAPSTWLSGSLDAQAGVLMRGDPQPGTPPYKQGSAPRIGFGDTARVVHYEPKHCVPVGCFEHVLVVDETNPLDPGDGHQFKYYAEGVGNISVAPGKGGKEREILELVKVQTLRPKTLAKLDREALRLDRRAYRTVKRVWARSGRARPRSATTNASATATRSRAPWSVTRPTRRACARGRRARPGAKRLTRLCAPSKTSSAGHRQKRAHHQCVQQHRQRHTTSPLEYRGAPVLLGCPSTAATPASGHRRTTTGVSFCFHLRGEGSDCRARADRRG